MWYSSGVNVAIQSGYLRLINRLDSEYGFAQYVYNANETSDYTLSTYISTLTTGNIKMALYDENESEITRSDNLVLGLNKITVKNKKISKVALLCEANADVNLWFIKLEKGSYFTGMTVWNYVNEVIKCHSKMIGLGSIESGDISIGSANVFNNEVWIMIPLTNYFIKKPTVYSTGTIKLILDGYDEATITNLSLVAFSNQSAIVKGILSKSLSSYNGQIARVIMPSGSRIIFDGNDY